ncbi:cytidylate kinase [Clostridia bacterium]|nr:cytidylate kinase [Clostridia bacterium]
MSFNIAIDGPAGAGKSTIAKNVAKALSYIYVDTGALYRAMALHFLRNHTDSAQENAVAAACADISITLSYDEGVQKVILNGEDVTGKLRTEEVGNTASIVSAYPAVREKLLQLQRDLAASENVVMDGRDIGSHVLPKADIKIYLTASSDVRAERRYEELRAKGITCDIAKLKADIEERDQRDMNRDIAPLKQAEDAIYLDSSNLTISEVTERILELVTIK